MLIGAMDALLFRSGFRAALSAEPTVPSDPTFESATIAKCPAGKKLPEGAEDLLRKTVLIQVPAGHGSGFFISPDGLVLTAAHVVESGKAKLRLRDGTEMDAVPVRVARHLDVALLRTKQPFTGSACLSPRADVPGIGADVYAAGAPASLALAFSLTRGIVSGVPVIEGQRRVQTDTPLNPGNSGGPLADFEGNAVGVVSFKLAGGKVEGLGFAVPIQDAMKALGLVVSDATDPKLRVEKATDVEKESRAVRDTPDPIPSLDPEGDLSPSNCGRIVGCSYEASTSRCLGVSTCIHQDGATTCTVARECRVSSVCGGAVTKCWHLTGRQCANTAGCSLN